MKQFFIIIYTYKNKFFFRFCISYYVLLFLISILWLSIDDQDFDPSAEMMIFDHDDERTLDEEEALSNSESVTQELSQLENVRTKYLLHIM